MMKNFIIITIVCFIVLLSGCSLNIIMGSDNIVPVELDFVPTGFTGVEVSTSINAVIIKADTFDVSITANDNLVEYLEVSQENNILRMELTGYLVSFTNVQVNAIISMPDCRYTTATTSGSITMNGFSHPGILYLEATTSASITLGKGMNTEHLSIIANTSGQITGTVFTTETVSIDASTSGVVQFSGSMKEAYIQGSTSAFIDIREIPAQKADVILSTSAQAFINVTDLLNVDLSTSGVCSYKGNPKFGSIIINTSGQLIHLD